MTTYFKDDGISRLNIKDYNTGEKAFYRMRNSQEYVQYEKNEMYHIPFDKNYLVGNERFSITGFPTLYLSSYIIFIIINLWMLGRNWTGKS